MHNLMIVNSWQYFIGLNKFRTIGEKNIQDMAASSENIDCEESHSFQQSPVYHTK